VMAARAAGASMVLLKPITASAFARRLGLAPPVGNPIFTAPCSDASGLSDTASDGEAFYI
jgi:hypothetical protein